MVSSEDNEAVGLEQSLDQAEAPAVAVHERRTGPWGFWQTIGLSLVIGVGHTLAQVVLVVAVTIAALVRTENLDIEQFAQDLITNGLFWSAAVCVAAPPTIVLTVLFAAIVKGITVRDYLALRWCGWKVVGQWCLILLLLIVFIDGTTYLLYGRLVPAFMETVYRTAYFVPLLWFAFVIVAPIAEELFFRGFMFKGLAHSRVGPGGAIAITAFAWALMHSQYDLYGMGTIFAGGLLLGYARQRSGSLYVPIAMHMAQNVVATVEVALYYSTMATPT